YLIEESRELILSPTNQANMEVINNPLALNLTVNQYTKSRPADEATIGFDLYRMNQQMGRREIIGRNWSGMGALGSQMTYDISDVYLQGSGKKYELRFKINLAQGEQAD
ncbi:MAG TPA: hypothetical protein VKB86_18475, partial [Pyrinomonadaceae bacterium]|nr:hypothetical protein [Pyrinomonadaceae bacterium]